nr:methyltransferase domain-containing protein [Massilia sp. TS11]
MRIAGLQQATSHALRDYTKLVRDLIEQYPHDYPLAMARAVGSLSLAGYHEAGDHQIAVLKLAGLQNGQAVYDLACGSGRTAAALQRHGWTGNYRGADLVKELVDYARVQCPTFDFFVHRDYSLRAPDASLDMVYAWSLFTHLQLEEIYLYAQDAHRVLKPGGIFAFSVLTLDAAAHRDLLITRANAFKSGAPMPHLDFFVSRSMIEILMTDMLGFTLQDWIDADDPRATGSVGFGQAVAIYRK